MRDLVFSMVAACVVLVAAAWTADAQNAPSPQPAKPSTANEQVAKPADATVDGWSGEVANGQDGIHLDEAQTEAVKSVSNYFSTLTDLKGAFVQIGADNKRMRGKFFVKRPGRFRFDYALPSRQIIISDGKYLAIQDLDLNNEDRLELDQTPFRLLLRKDVDLLRDARIIEVQDAADRVVVGIQDKSPDTPGKIKLFLSKKPPGLELTQWITTDAQGLDTRIEVTELVKTDDLDANLFKIQMLGAHRTTPN